MSDDIKPALTPEQWAKGEFVNHDIEIEADASSLAVCDSWKEGVGAAGEERHALAALALYQQPFGFTHEDVDTLRNVEAMLRNRGNVRDDEIVARIADRIAALLPPPDFT